MSMSPGSRGYKLVEAIGTVGVVAFWVFIGVVVLQAMLIETDSFSWKAAAIVGRNVAVAVLIVGTLAVIALDVQRHADQVSSDEQAARRKANERAALDARAQEHSRQTCAKSIITNSQQAVAVMSGLPTHLKNAKSWTQAAVAHHKDGAFSPFWSDIEQAYACLAAYRSAADTITQAATAHARYVELLIAADGDPKPFLTFPVTLDAQRVSSTLQEATEDLESMVYQAQKHPVFAQIWEQRRTTAAVVAGFANLEIAVRHMGGAISASMSSLADAISMSNDRVELAVRNMSADVSSRLVSVGTEQAKAMNQVGEQVKAAKQEIYYQNWGHYSLLG